MSDYFDPENEYWHYHAFTNSSQGNYIQKPGNPSYVTLDQTASDWESAIIPLATTTDNNLKYVHEIRFHTNLHTDQPIVYPGDTATGTDGEDLITITLPTKAEWDAMSESERDTAYRQYFFYDPDNPSVALGLYIGDYYAVSYCSGICEDDDTFTNYQHQLCGGVATNYSGNQHSLTNTNGHNPVYRTEIYSSAKPWYIEQDQDYQLGYKRKFLTVSARAYYVKKFWNGFMGSSYYYKTKQTAETSPLNNIECDIHSIKQYIDGSHNEGYPYCENYKDVDRSLFLPPYPPFVWTINAGKNDGYPMLVSMDNVKRIGAFGNASKLKNVKIPASVKVIKDYAFYNTKIRSVTVASDCVYSEHSFPPGCVIDRYLE